MKQKLMPFSALLIISISIIFLLPWTISANENTDKAIVNTDNTVEDASNTVEDASNTVEDASDTVEDASDTVEDASDTVEDTSNTVEDTSNTVEDASDTVEDTSNTVEDTSNTVEDTSNTVENTDNTVENTDNINGSILLPLNANISVEINYNESGPFKMGDVVNITATFDKPVVSAYLMVSDDVSSPINMVNVNDTTWYCEYEVPEGVNGAVNVTVLADDSKGNKVGKTDIDAFVVDDISPDFTETVVDDISQDFTETVIDDTSPEFAENEPSEFVSTNLVLFNFSASDDLDDDITYTLYINGSENSTGVIAKDECKEVEVNLDDGYYTWEVKLKDKTGNIGSSDVYKLYVDTKAPEVALVSPEDGLVNTEGPVNFSFISDDDFTAQHKDLNLSYRVDITAEDADEDTDENADGLWSGTMRPGEYIQIPVDSLSEGAYEWSVYIEDEAGNNITSESRSFYVNKEGLKVSLTSPNKGDAPANKTFNFCVSGGTGLPFEYKLLINGEEVENSTCEESEDGTLTVGGDLFNNYSVNAAVADGEDLMWTVNITDCAGNTYEPQPYHFSLNTVAPARVANLSVKDAPGVTNWSYTYDQPRLYVSWNANTEKDLAPTPYEAFISDFEPQSIEDMKKVKSTSDTSLYIEECGGKPLVYGKDYWVAVISRDNAGNYNKCFVAICGPVQTFEDMNVTLDQGWNLKSVPKRLLASNASPESVFGKGSTVLYWNGKCWKSPETIESYKGYWIYSPEAFENNIKFKPMSFNNTTPDVPASLNLVPGWQIIGSTSTQPASWSTTLASLKDPIIEYKFSNLVTYSHHEGWSGTIPELGLANMLIGGGSATSGRVLINYSGSGPAGTLQYKGMMVPGQGYWVHMNKEGTYDSIESVYDRQNSSESDGTVDNGTTAVGTDDDVSTDNGTSDVGTSDVVVSDDGTSDVGVSDDGITDVGVSDDGTSDVGTTDIET